MNVAPDDLADRLVSRIEPLYLIHGDEPLLALEAGDAIRAAALKAGAIDREVFLVEQGFKWDAFVAANANLGLFGDRRVFDVRIPNGKPGVEGAKVLERLAGELGQDNVTLITLPRVDKATQASGWFSALERKAVVVAVTPVERNALPRWIAQRLKRQQQQATPETLAFLADHCEGNLLAARQEIEKLALSLPQGMLDHDAIENAVADVARFDMHAASEAWLAGDAPRLVRVLAAIEEQGDGPQLGVWTLSEDLHALAAVSALVRAGTPMAIALRNARVWGRRGAAMERAVRRVGAGVVEACLRELAGVDALSKGIGRGDAWQALRGIAMKVAGAAFAASGRLAA